MTAILTLDEVAKLLRKSPRWIREWLRDHPRDAYDPPLFGKAGRTLLFTENHLHRIVEASPCPSRSLALTSVSAWIRARPARFPTRSFSGWFERRIVC
jgi:hypothetical protein